MNGYEQIRLKVLRELGEYELGVGWAYEEKEKRACKKMAAEGLLVRLEGYRYEITEAGRQVGRDAGVISHDRTQVSLIAS